MLDQTDFMILYSIIFLDENSNVVEIDYENYLDLQLESMQWTSTDKSISFKPKIYETRPCNQDDLDKFESGCSDDQEELAPIFASKMSRATCVKDSS